MDIQPPIPLEHPKKSEEVQGKVERLVRENNKKYSISKAERQRAAEEEKQRLREKREKMKKYGREQIVRAHNYDEQFEHKHSWGYDQTREKRERQKQRELKEFRKELEELKKAVPSKKMKLSELFPEGSGESEYRKIWKQEGVRATKKKVQAKSVERVPQRELKEFNQKEVKKKIESNAKQHIEEMKLLTVKQKQELLLKKHKINYVDREAKQILKRTKKRSFNPHGEFVNKMVPTEHSVKLDDAHPSSKRYYNVNDEMLLDEQQYHEYHQHKVGAAG